MRRVIRLVAAASVVVLSGCSNMPDKDWALLPAAALLATDAGYLTAPVASAAVIAYVVMDPFAPNWTIEEVRQSDERYRIALRLKAMHSGGDGEARQVFARRAAQLGAQAGFAGYEIVAWQQGIESTRPFAQRVAYGEVRLIRATPPLARSPE